MPLSRDWAKSSHSTSNGGNCVEVRDAGTGVQVRDSKHAGGPFLAFPRTAWLAFTAELKRVR